MPTARDLIIDAYQISGLRSPTENPTAEDTDIALRLLNWDLIPLLRIDDQYPSFTKVYEFNTASNHPLVYTVGVPVVGQPAPDWAVSQEIVRIEFAQVKIGQVWQPLRQINATDYYRMSQANVSVIPVQFAFNRTHDPYDQFILTYSTPGIYTIRLAVNGTTANYSLDDEISLPSGYYPLLKFGVARLLALANGMDDATAKMTNEFNACMKRITQVTTSIPPKLKVGQVFAQYNLPTDTMVYPVTGGI